MAVGIGRIVAGIFILSILASTIILSQGVCEPDCSESEDFERVADPKNCSHYYICLDHKALDYSKPCPDGEEFNSTLHECIEAFNCSDSCGGREKCKYSCSEDVEGINDPFDCTGFYQCGPIGPGPEQHCPTDMPYYDSIENKCTDDKYVCCIPSCDPYCDGALKLIPDPLNCTKYYVCEEEGEPEPELHFKCDVGSYFDLVSERCSPDVECQTLCPENSTSGGTTGSGGSSTYVTSSVDPVSTTDCVESLMCKAEGIFPKCHSCEPEYFDCKQIGQFATVMTCNAGYTFNTDVDYPGCILASSCPYHP